jgi:hypothetical protein
VSRRRAAVHYLTGQLGWSPEFVVADADQRGRFLATDAAFAVAVCTALVAEEGRSGLFGRFLLGVQEGMGGGWNGDSHRNGEDRRKEHQT